MTEKTSKKKVADADELAGDEVVSLRKAIITKEESVDEILKEVEEEIVSEEEEVEVVIEEEEEEIIEEADEELEKTLKEFKPVEEFDWDNYEQDAHGGAAKRSEMEKMYNETLSTVVENEVVDGTVIAMNKREVVINIGYKSEGVVSLNEFRYNPELTLGDTVEVYIESQEDKNGQLVLSHKKARALRSWDRVNEALEKDEIIKGYIKCRTKGGMIVDVFGIEAFLPGSQIDVKPIRDYDIFVGKTMEFKVVKINHEFKNVVVSHKALIEAELEQQKKEIISKLEKGQVLEGTVKNITSYGVFIDLGGVDGLIHITDLSWGRVNHPEEIVKLDQKLNVVILDFDNDKKRIALGLKQLTPHPWDSLNQDLKVGDRVKGKVVVLADYGAFIEIATGVEGLIHVSDLSWTKKIKHPAEFTTISADIDVVVLEIDKDNRRLSLGHKQLEENPWEVFETIFFVDSIHEGTVVELVEKGAMIALPYGVEGFVSQRNMAKEDGSVAKIDEKLQFKVVEFSKTAKKIVVSHTRTFEEDKRSQEPEQKKSNSGGSRKSSPKVVKSSAEKTTLGDISDLAALKTELEEKEKKSKKN